MVEHVSAREEQDGDEAHGGPEIPVLDHRHEIRPRNREEGDQADDCGGADHYAEIVDGSDERRSWSVRQIARDPGVRLFGALGTGERVSYCVFFFGNQECFMGPYPLAKSYRRGCPSALAPAPTVGGNSNRTGAVCNIIWNKGQLQNTTGPQSDLANSPSGRYFCPLRNPMCRKASGLLPQSLPSTSSSRAARIPAGILCTSGSHISLPRP